MPPPTQLFIDGSWVESATGETFPTIDPATATTITQVARAGPADAARAVAAARRAFDEGPWGPESDPRERARVLLGAAEWIRSQRDRLARIEVADCGKPLEDALWDVDEAAYMFEYYAGWATKVMGVVPPVGPDALSIVLKEPVGVAALITPGTTRS